MCKSYPRVFNFEVRISKVYMSFFIFQIVSRWVSCKASDSYDKLLVCMKAEIIVQLPKQSRSPSLCLDRGRVGYIIDRNPSETHQP